MKIPNKAETTGKMGHMGQMHSWHMGQIHSCVPTENTQKYEY